MKAQLVLNCNGCFEDTSLEITIKGKTMPLFSDIMKEAQKQGWRIGRDCYCPSCYEALPAHCDTCMNYEGNKSMGAPVCRRDGAFATPTDFCKHHQPYVGPLQPFLGYKNPIPHID